MTFLEKTELLERLDQLIRMKATGNARQLADRLNVSKSTVYEILEVMKNMGADIKYCNTKKTFYYQTIKVLAIGFVDANKVKGGKKYGENIILNQVLSI